MSLEIIKVKTMEGKHKKRKRSERTNDTQN